MGKVGQIRQEKVEDLVPYDKNARVHDDAQVELIAQSIKEFGFLNPILIDKDKNVIAGHGRILGAKKLGMEKVPVLYIEGLTDEQRRAYILADNRLTEIGGWDMDTVGEELQELQEAGFDIGLIGFDWDNVASLDPIEEPFKTADEILEPVEKKEDDAKTKTGDLWILGRHRLLCGDSTSPEDMDRLFDGRGADLVFTDPPYGVAIGTKNRQLEEVRGIGGGNHRRHRGGHAFCRRPL